MSLVGSYGSHLLHSFHPHLLQTLNHHGMLANGNAAAAASYFAGERSALSKPPTSAVLTNFQLPSAFSPPKYIGISLDQVNAIVLQESCHRAESMWIFLISISLFFHRISSMVMNRFVLTRRAQPAPHTSPWRVPMTTRARRARAHAAMPQIRET